MGSCICFWSIINTKVWSTLAEHIHGWVLTRISWMMCSFMHQMFNESHVQLSTEIKNDCDTLFSESSSWLPFLGSLLAWFTECVFFNPATSILIAITNLRFIQVQGTLNIESHIVGMGWGWSSDFFAVDLGAKISNQIRCNQTNSTNLLPTSMSDTSWLWKAQRQLVYETDTDVVRHSASARLWKNRWRGTSHVDS